MLPELVSFSVWEGKLTGNKDEETGSGLKSQCLSGGEGMAAGGCSHHICAQEAELLG